MLSPKTTPPESQSYFSFMPNLLSFAQQKAVDLKVGLSSYIYSKESKPSVWNSAHMEKIMGLAASIKKRLLSQNGLSQSQIKALVLLSGTLMSVILLYQKMNPASDNFQSSPMSLSFIDCPNPYTCPTPMEPFPDELNGCNATSFLLAFNSTVLNGVCDLFAPLTHMDALTEALNACRSCLFDGIGQDIYDQCATAIFYSNKTLCASGSSDDKSHSGFDLTPVWIAIGGVGALALCYAECRAKCIARVLSDFVGIYRQDQREQDAGALALAGAGYGAVPLDGAQPDDEEAPAQQIVAGLGV